MEKEKSKKNLHFILLEYFLIFIIIATAVIFRLNSINSSLIGHLEYFQVQQATACRNLIHRGSILSEGEKELNTIHPMNANDTLSIYAQGVRALNILFGEKELWGKALSIFFSILALLFFYLLIRRYYSLLISIFALLFFAFSPLSIYIGRAYLDLFAVLSMVIGSFYFFALWIEKQKLLLLIPAALFGMLAVVMHPGALYILPLILLFVLKGNKTLFKKPSFWFFISLLTLPGLIWNVSTFNSLQQYGVPRKLMEPEGIHLPFQITHRRERCILSRGQTFKPLRNPV